jgi:hypothetical protein
MTKRSSMITGIFALVATTLGLLAACSGGGSSSGGGGTPPPGCQDPLPSPMATPHFSTDLLPMFQATCGSATSTCHGAVTVPTGHFSWATGGGRTAQDVYNDLINIPSSEAPGWVRVKPSDPAHSWLIEKVSSASPGGGYGAQMPYAAQPLCTTTINNLKTWIQNGAPF